MLRCIMLQLFHGYSMLCSCNATSHGKDFVLYINTSRSICAVLNVAVVTS